MNGDILPPKWVKDVRISHEWKHEGQITLSLANSVVVDVIELVDIGNQCHIGNQCRQCYYAILL